MEWIILSVSLIVNFWQFNSNGELRAERDNFQAIADACSKDGEEERRNTTLEASRRAVTEAASDKSYQEFKFRGDRALQDAGNSCLDSPAGDLADRLVDAERRFVEELHRHRMQPKP